jgi:hypothetical protein
VIGLFIRNYAYNVFVSVDQLVNAALLFGDPDETVSGRIGKSIAAGGFWSCVPLPAFLLKHFANSIERDRGSNSAAQRKEIV